MKTVSNQCRTACDTGRATTTSRIQNRFEVFGKINEEDGKVTFVFDFVNRGSGPLVVSRVQASCGCTTPTWTKEPIEPGKKGSITVTYNPAGRPGVFTKTITVYSNATEEQAGLMIKGEVIPKSNVETDAFSLSMGDLKLKTKVVQMNNVEKGKSQIREIEIKNGGTSTVKPTVENMPSYLTAVVTPEVLKANETGKIKITFNSKNCSQWGPVNDEAYIVINGQKKFTEDYQLKVFGNIVENFSTMTLDQKQKAPIMEIKDRTIDLGIIKPDTKKAVKFKAGSELSKSVE